MTFHSLSHAFPPLFRGASLPLPQGAPPTGSTPLADFITYQDAITKMRFAKQNLETNGQPFFLVAGIKRPHLNWRSPERYVDLYPLENVSVPKQLTLDRSIDPVAWASFPMDAPASVCNSSSTHCAGEHQPPPAAPAMIALDPVCGEVMQNTGGGKTERRVTQYPEGLKVANISQCCELCTPGNPISCEAWIYNEGQSMCWPMAEVHGYRHVPGNFIGGRVLPGPPAPPAPRAPRYPVGGRPMTPYNHGTDHQLRKLRQHYYATVSWADYAAGRVLAELDSLGLTDSTMVRRRSGVFMSTSLSLPLSLLFRLSSSFTSSLLFSPLVPHPGSSLLFALLVSIPVFGVSPARCARRSSRNG